MGRLILFSSSMSKLNTLHDSMRAFSAGSGAQESQCPHLHAMISNEDERQMVLKKVKTVMTWNSRRSHESCHPAKRRKVC